jgi:hypothetical protein
MLGMIGIFDARCTFATSRQIQMSMNNRNLNLGRWGFTLAPVSIGGYSCASCATSCAPTTGSQERRRLGATAPASQEARCYVLNPTRFAA